MTIKYGQSRETGNWVKENSCFVDEYVLLIAGVAGFVVNDKNQLLVIQEKFNISKKHWKLPGGLADKGMGNSKSRNTLSLAEIHLKIVQMNLQWIENSEITHI